MRAIKADGWIYCGSMPREWAEDAVDNLELFERVVRKLVNAGGIEDRVAQIERGRAIEAETRAELAAARR